jgi:hypothetical protein
VAQTLERSETASAQAQSVYVLGEDTYVVGDEFEANDGHYAALWKNGVVKRYDKNFLPQTVFVK